MVCYTEKEEKPFWFSSLCQMIEFCRTYKSTFGQFFYKKSLIMPKKTESGRFKHPGMVSYPEKEEKPFWFSSVGQIFQFGTIKLWRTLRPILVTSCRLKKVTIIVTFHFMKRRVKKPKGKNHPKEKHLKKKAQKKKNVPVKMARRNW